MGDLTRNFSRSEFRCRGLTCCDHSAPISLALVEALQELRDKVATVQVRAGFAEADAALHPTCGFRCLAHNRTIEKSSDESQHVLGLAADIMPPRFMRPERLAEIAETVPAFQRGGVGIYYWGVHFDVRGWRVRWDDRTQRGG